MTKVIEGIPVEKAKELFDKMREAVDEPTLPEDSEESAKVKKSSGQIRTGASAMSEWQEKQEEIEDKRHTV